MSDALKPRLTTLVDRVDRLELQLERKDEHIDTLEARLEEHDNRLEHHEFETDRLEAIVEVTHKTHGREQGPDQGTTNPQTQEESPPPDRHRRPSRDPYRRRSS
ncbi:hypothetical protein [Natrinema hispanicum]|uniref:hypothetical protein n=1 Tax=Natrinema hispanicum TaxID=392421 RepID=UPI00102BF596|nr:hypothetical protein [Natrinema hispanicum]